MRIHTHIRRPNKEVRATLQLVMRKLEEALRLSKIKEEETYKRG
ncbi:MAG: hypothetical protein ABR584_11425 [Candidatus Baltobacteraceae bacterium]